MPDIAFCKINILVVTLFSFPEALSFMIFIYLQVNGSVGKLLKSGRDLDDSLIAVVIRNLKTIEVCMIVSCSFFVVYL